MPFSNWRVLAVAFFITICAIVPARSRGSGGGKETKKQEKKQEKIAIAFPEAVAEAEANAPPAGYASLYVLRPPHVAGMVGGFMLWIDGTLWGCIDNGEFTWDPLPAGQHTFARDIYHFGSSGPITIEAGKTYYLQVSAEKAKVLTPEEGESIRRTLTLDPERWFYRQYLANWGQVRIGMKAEDVERLLRLSNGTLRIAKADVPGGVPKGATVIGNVPIFKGVAAVGDAPLTGPLDDLADQFTSSVLGYQLTFINGTLANKLNSGQVVAPYACLPGGPL